MIPAFPLAPAIGMLTLIGLRETTSGPTRLQTARHSSGEQMHSDSNWALRNRYAVYAMRLIIEGVKHQKC